MCKIFAMTNMERVALTPHFIRVVRDNVCKTSDRDGFGYAALGQDNSLGGERTMRPFNFAPMCVNPADSITAKLPITLKTRNHFGMVNLKKPKSFIAHGRLSTNTVCVENTHPFTNGEVALVHNGVVHDEGGLAKNLLTNCDSEIILRYWEMGGMKDVEENVSGYYAVAVLDKKGQLHIARDDTAMLYISWIRTVQSFMVATTMDIIKGVCKKMKWKYDQPEELKENIYVVFDKNDILVNRKIEPIGRWSSYMSARERAALGYDGDYGYGEYWRTGGTPSSTTGTSSTSTASGGTTSTSKSAEESAKVFSESDPTADPEPSYREAVAKDDFYEGRAGSKTEGESFSTQTSTVPLSGAFSADDPEEYETTLKPGELEDIPGANDEGDGRATTRFYSEDEEAERIQDAVEAMESYGHLRRGA